MVNALQILTFWPTFAKDVEESTSYSASSEEYGASLAITFQVVTMKKLNG